MPSKPPKVYWDACAFIGRIQREPDKIVELEQLTELATQGKLLIVTSTLTIAEVLKEPALGPSDDEKFRSIADFFENPWIILRNVDRRIAETAAKLRITYEKLRTPDAIHLATAIRWQVVAFHTYDHKDLLKRNGLIGDPPLEIVKPCYPEKNPLFDSLEERPGDSKKDASDS